MIYLIKSARMAGHIVNNTKIKDVFKINNKINIDVIHKLFMNYKVIDYMKNGGLHNLKLKQTLINIYLNK